MLKDDLNKDLIQALKAKDEGRVAVLRLLNSALHNKEIEKRSKSGLPEPLTDEETEGVLRAEAKKRKEAILLYRQGNREDLARKEEAELRIIEEYLPAELSQEELEKIIDGVFSELGPAGPADFGKVMGAVMKRIAGRADAQKVSAIVKERLQNLRD